MRLSQDLQSLLLSSIDPVAAVRVLVVFHGDPLRSWTLAEMTTRLGLSVMAASNAFIDLGGHDFVSPAPSSEAFRLRPMPQPTSALLDALRQALAEDASVVARAIGERSCARLRALTSSFTHRI
ncbi:MAG: hypothetical protein Q8O67_05665 [Deltaproteobacteria bacterium]|nr:hypothetical protein [Deltaproteobacteria bacterium]